MKKLIVDLSSVLWSSLLAGKSVEFGYEVEFEGRQVHVNGWQHGLDNAINHVTSVCRELGILAGDIILVVEGKMSKARRVALYSDYKASRGGRPPEAYEEFNRCKEEVIKEFTGAGATAVTQDGVEGDDVIAYLCGVVEGSKVILSNDGDLAALMNKETSMWRNGALLTTNPFGPFDTKYINVYKALVGDSSDNIKGAPGFGDKAFLKMLLWGGDGILPALATVIQKRELDILQDDVAEFKPFQKIIDGAASVYTSWDVAQLYPDWVNTKRQPLVTLDAGAATDERVIDIKSDAKEASFDRPKEVRKHVVFDSEIIGLQNPVFLLCAEIVETGERFSFWHHVEGDMQRMKEFFMRKDLTFVSFNGINFDMHLVWAATSGLSATRLKQLASRLVEERFAYGLSDDFGYTKFDFDHIDLFEVAPGVQVSLKTFAGRIHYPTMQDMPFHHDDDLEPEQYPEVEGYCWNDVGVTKDLFGKLKAEVTLREEMSVEHGIDLRSKSDPQVAEAILKKAANIRQRAEIPLSVTYKTPAFIQTDSDAINELIHKIENHTFKIDQNNGSPVFPDFLKDPIKIGHGTYQFGLGGIHSTHDVRFFAEAGDGMRISDIDVASYYPNIIINVGLIPKLPAGAGERFIAEYTKMYETRMGAKRAGNKKVSNSLKIALNGTFGKLGSRYSWFYSPDLMLATTLTGQLNLLCLIYDLEFNKNIKVLSANTDGLMVSYPEDLRDKVLRKVVNNAKTTGFEYEETCYRRVAIANVNNYVCTTSDDIPVIVLPSGEIIEGRPDGGVAKRKGVFASSDPAVNPLYLQKNPSFEVCSDAVVEFVLHDTPLEDTIRACTDIRKFVSIRNVKGGGVQFGRYKEVDDWFEVEEDGVTPGVDTRLWTHPGRTAKPVKRKSRPAARVEGCDPVHFGRVARWYFGEGGQSLHYVGSGNKVPQTDSAVLALNLPTEFPEGVDYDWYITEANKLLNNVGVGNGEEILDGMVE